MTIITVRPTTESKMQGHRYNDQITFFTLDSKPVARFLLRANPNYLGDFSEYTPLDDPRALHSALWRLSPGDDYIHFRAEVIDIIPGLCRADTATDAVVAALKNYLVGSP